MGGKNRICQRSRPVQSTGTNILAYLLMTRKRYQISHWNLFSRLFRLALEDTYQYPDCQISIFTVSIQNINLKIRSRRNICIHSFVVDMFCSSLSLLILRMIRYFLSNSLTDNYPLLFSGPSLCTNFNDGKIVQNIFFKW